MKILITGGAGTLGSSLIEKFIPEGHEVLVIDNFATGKREVVPDVDGLTLIEGDIQITNWFKLNSHPLNLKLLFIAQLLIKILQIGLKTLKLMS